VGEGGPGGRKGRARRRGALVSCRSDKEDLWKGAPSTALRAIEHSTVPLCVAGDAGEQRQIPCTKAEVDTMHESSRRAEADTMHESSRRAEADAMHENSRRAEADTMHESSRRAEADTMHESRRSHERDMQWANAAYTNAEALRVRHAHAQNSGVQRAR